MADIQKYVETAKNLEFCDDFGKEPVLLAHLTKDASTIAVISLLGGFVAMAALGFPGLVAVAFAALNDISYARSHDDDSPTVKNGETTIDVQSSTEAIESVGLGSAASIASVLNLPDEERSIDTTPIADIQQPSIAVPGFSQVAVSPTMSSFNEGSVIEPRDIATDLGQNPQSALIFGTPGAGKGVTISNAIRALKLKTPNITVMMVDPKAQDNEIGYWKSQVDIYERRSLLNTNTTGSAEWMMFCIDTFRNIKGPKVLIWDELFASITVLTAENRSKGTKELDAFPCLDEFKKFLNLTLSLGPGSGVFVWGMSQSANLSDLGLTSGGLSTTRIIALISPDNIGAVEGYLATKAITAPRGGVNYLTKLMKQSPVNRACYDGKTKQWYPTAKLINHSGFDRDNADWNNAKNNDVVSIDQLPPEMQVMAAMNSTVFTATAGSESDRFQSMLTNATAKALQGDRDAVESIRFASQLVEVGQKHQAIEALSAYA